MPDQTGLSSELNSSVEVGERADRYTEERASAVAWH